MLSVWFVVMDNFRSFFIISHLISGNSNIQILGEAMSFGCLVELWALGFGCLVQLWASDVLWSYVYVLIGNSILSQ
jgi:hypothetical protein